MHRTGHLELRPKLAPDQFAERLIVDHQVVLGLEPSEKVQVAAEAFRLVEFGFEGLVDLVG